LLSKLLSRDCTILHRAQSSNTNRYGDEIPAGTTEVTVCELQQVRRAESQEGEIAETTLKLYMLPTVSLTTGDAVTVGGITYELVGEPNLLHHPRTGTAHHLEATVRRTAGSEETA
jgi:hypothetical protein